MAVALQFQSRFSVVIRYILAEITTEVHAEDAQDAFHIALREGLANHGCDEPETFNFVLALLMEEQPERDWFKIRRIV
jgi:hypothetical protein